MIEHYRSQFERIQRLFIDNQHNLERNTTKEVISIIRQLDDQITKDLDKRLVLDDVHQRMNTLESILYVVENGEEEATSTGIIDIDKAWRWRKGETNMWTGYGNEGKSAFLNFLTLIKCKKDKDQKAAIFSPENQPSHFFYLDFIHTMLGRQPKPSDKNEVAELFKWLKDNIFFVYPDDFKLNSIHDEMQYLIDAKGVTICIIDPYLKVAHEYGNLPEHHYVSQFMTQIERFARNNQVSYHVVAHQNTPQIDPQTQNYPKPNGYRIKGGGNFYDGTDNQLSLWRPYRLTDYYNPEVKFTSQKIKKQKIVARPSEVTISFDFFKQRYVTQSGQDMYELAVNNDYGF